MNKPSIKKIGLTALAVLATAGAMFAQDLKVAPGKPWKGPMLPYQGPEWPGTPVFTNLGPTPSNLYDFNAGGYYVLGINNGVIIGSDQWIAVSFWTTTQAAAVRHLQAAIGLEPANPGTQHKVVLSVYSDDASLVPSAPGMPLGGKTATVPPSAPNALTVATLTTAINLAANTKYWLVATTTPTSDLGAIWYASNNAQIGANLPSQSTGWFSFSGLTPAGAVQP